MTQTLVAMSAAPGASPPQPIQILSLDGGGLKGLFVAAVLAQLEEDCRIRLADHFDLIAGTSTGGLIALGLGLGMRPREIVEFYVKRGPEIFGAPVRLGRVRKWWKPKYSSTGLGAALKSCFGSTTLGDSEKRLVIPSFNLADDDVYIFRTPHHVRLKRDYLVETWRVGMATTAAPTYFEAFKGVDNIPLVDGGVWANNPAMVATVEAAGTLEIPPSTIRVLSFGTTQPVKRGGKSLTGGGMSQWAMPISEVMLRGQTLSATNGVRHLIGKDRVLRLDPVVPDSAFLLDGLNFTDLMAMAAHESRKLCPDFEAMFSQHRAPAFVPLHRLEKDSCC
jgi:patatin-like phospholipase/acyl hydrolase